MSQVFKLLANSFVVNTTAQAIGSAPALYVSANVGNSVVSLWDNGASIGSIYVAAQQSVVLQIKGAWSINASVNCAATRVAVVG
jgi:hypothetical protein